MGNVLRVFWRDVKRIAKVPQAWSVVLALMILPSLYTWLNVAGFWNPYENTGNLRVCVVNEDAGVDDELLGELDLGSQIVDQLEGNDQLGWAFVSREEAFAEVESGEAYAAFVIPESFSADIATIVTGDFKQPVLEYYVNEKTGPVAPKITDTGASTLDTMINDKFVSTVSSTVVESIEEKAHDANIAMAGARSGISAELDEVGAEIRSVRSSLAGLAGEAGGVKEKTASARTLLDGAKQKLSNLSSGFANMSTLVSGANTGLTSFASKAGTALDAAAADSARVSAVVDESVATTMDEVLLAKGKVDEAIGNARIIARDYSEAVALLKELRELVPDETASDTLRSKLDEAMARLEESSQGATGSVDELSRLSEQLGQMAQGLKDATSNVDGRVDETIAGAEEYRNMLAGETIPTLSTSLADISTASGTLSSSVASQQLIVDEARAALDQLDSTLDAATGSLNATADALGAIEGEFASLRSDLAALGASSDLRALQDEGGLDPEQIAEFMLSPTTVKTEKLYALNAYGSAMAPLFINLTLWIGVFMLMVIIRNEVDDEGVERLTLTQRYFGRGLLLSVIAAFQAIICCTGCLAMGVQCASVPLFYLTGVVASLSYLAIQYTLSSTFQHVGKAICVVLVFVQIPAATGLYPIEMTPQFFQAIYPLFPFTYGINAIRETIGGFYGSLWATNVATLLAFLAAFLVIAVLVRPSVTNLNRMFARQIEESDILNGEASVLPARRYRYTQVLRALADREEYRREIVSRTRRFMELYPLLKQFVVFIGLFVPILATSILLGLGVEKVVILTTWLVWFLVVLAVAIAIDYVQDNLSHQVSLEGMSDDEVRTLYGERQRYTKVRSLDENAEGERPVRLAVLVEDGKKAQPGSEPWEPWTQDGQWKDGGRDA